MKICLKCLKYYKDDMVFCPECAERLEEVDVANQPNKYMNNKADNNSFSQANEDKTLYAGYNGAGGFNENKAQSVYNNSVPGSGNSPYNTPVNNMNNNYPQVQVPVNNQGQNKGLYALIGIFAAIIVVSGIIILVLLMSNGKNANESSHGYEAEENLTEAVEAVVEETTTQPVTHVPTTVYQSPTERFSAYNTFNSFYVSYLDSINFMDSGYLGYCSENVRYEMIERFQYNRKSLFDLRRIDFDEDSYSTYTVDGKKYHNFYVKCVSEYYDRASYANKGYNYAIWYVTVTQEGDYCYVSYLARDDKYILSTNVHTITDSVVLNYSYF